MWAWPTLLCKWEARRQRKIHTVNTMAKRLRTRRWSKAATLPPLYISPPSFHPQSTAHLLLQFRICISVLATAAVNIINVILKPARKTARTTQRRQRLRLRALSLLALECWLQQLTGDRSGRGNCLPPYAMPKCLSVNAAAVHAPAIHEHYQRVLNYSTNRGRTAKSLFWFSSLAWPFFYGTFNDFQCCGKS